MEISVTKRDGSKVPFNANRINKSIERASRGIKDPINKVVQIAIETRFMLYDGITTEELDEATINAALQNVSEDIAYDKIATRLLLKIVYKGVLGHYEEDEPIDQKHKEGFIAHLKKNVHSGLLDSRLIEKFDLNKLASALDLNKDDLFKYAGLSTLLNRYALKKEGEVPIETPQYLFMRVAMGLSYNENNPTEAALKFYNKISSLDYLPGGSTIMNAGTSTPSLSNCFLLEIHDDIDHIAKSISDIIKISKATGGIGASLTKLRASGSTLSKSNTVSSGPTPFAKIIDTAVHAIVRGGKKKGALCFYMENWHINFPEFLMWRHNAGDDYLRMRTANTAVYLSDEFMKRVQSKQDWYMFDPKETGDLNELYGEKFSKRYAEYIELAKAGKMKMFKVVPAEEQLRQILVMLQTTSHPWLTFKDPINLRALNNNTGTIHMSNLCTEICLPQDKDNIAVCNLASINIVNHIENGSINWEKLKNTTKIAIRHLDNLIDISKLPIKEAIKSDKDNRAIGLGVMGFAEAVELLKLPYDSEEAYNLSDKIFEYISYIAIEESTNLASERGSYSNFNGSLWSKGMVPIDTIANLENIRGESIDIDRTQNAELSLDWNALREKVKKGMRNATLMAVAPNANIGLVAGTTPGIDPRFAQVFSRSKISGKYIDINHNLVKELEDLDLWEKVKSQIIEYQGDISKIDLIPEDIKNRYKSAFTTSPYAFIEVAARAQKWIDQSLSRNMYLETRDIEEILDIYITAWKKGLKTTYYLHMKPRHTAEQSTVAVNKGKEIGKIGFGAIPEEKIVETIEPVKDEIIETAEETHVCPVDPQERLQCDSCQ